MASELGVCGAPPGFRTQNLRIKRRRIIVPVVSPSPVTCGFFRCCVHLVCQSPVFNTSFATEFGTKDLRIPTEHAAQTVARGIHGAWFGEPDVS